MAVKVDVEEKEAELADKPGSVESNHSSGIHVTVQLKQPTQKPYGPHVAPILFPFWGMFLYLVLLQVGFSLPLMLP